MFYVHKFGRQHTHSLSLKSIFPFECLLNANSLPWIWVMNVSKIFLPRARQMINLITLFYACRDIKFDIILFALLVAVNFTWLHSANDSRLGDKWNFVKMFINQIYSNSARKVIDNSNYYQKRFLIKFIMSQSRLTENMRIFRS